MASAAVPHTTAVMPMDCRVSRTWPGSWPRPRTSASFGRSCRPQGHTGNAAAAVDAVSAVPASGKFPPSVPGGVFQLGADTRSGCSCGRSSGRGRRCCCGEHPLVRATLAAIGGRCRRRHPAALISTTMRPLHFGRGRQRSLGTAIQYENAAMPVVRMVTPSCRACRWRQAPRRLRVDRVHRAIRCPRRRFPRDNSRLPLLVE